MKSKNIARLLLLATAIASSIAEAHSLLITDDGLVNGLMHPFAGFDHLLAMVAVGIWAGQLGGRATWLVPATFIGIMVAAAGIATWGGIVLTVESALANSILVLGLIVANTVRLPMPTVLSLVGLFAFCHGYAHGLEMAQVSSPVRFQIGLVLATILLHGIGIGIGQSRRLHYYELLQRVAGMSLMTASAWFLVA